jgi:aryl-alcohol dehydrogenase-like predicted oxidoreductase
MGTWAWGDKLFWDYGNSYGASQVEEAFKAAVGAGITFFDTAELYGMGESETLLGRFIKSDSWCKKCRSSERECRRSRMATRS